MFVLPEYQSAMEKLALRALRKDVVRIAQELPGADIAIQFDIAADFIMMEAQKDATYLETLRADFHPRSEDLKELYSNQYIELIGFVDPAGSIGFHICPGNIGNRAVLEPKDMSLSVELANMIMSRMSRPLQWVHFGIYRHGRVRAIMHLLRVCSPVQQSISVLCIPTTKKVLNRGLLVRMSTLRRLGLHRGVVWEGLRLRMLDPSCV